MMREQYGASHKSGGAFADAKELLFLSLKLQLGKRYWLYCLLPLLWVLFHSFMLAVGWNDERLVPGDAQNMLIGIPLYLLAIAIGMQIISSEIEQRTLEVCYTVPGGARRIWLSKLAAAILVLLVALVLLALYTWLVLTPFPPAALYRVLQGCIFYLVLSMGFGALLRNKMSAGLASFVVLFMNGAVTGMGENPTRFSPLFNPTSLLQSMSSEEVLYWLIQNHGGVALITATLLVLTFSRAERRELLLSDD